MPKLKTKRGPKEERLVLKGGWEKAIRKAVKKKRPSKGWPKKKR